MLTCIYIHTLGSGTPDVLNQVTLPVQSDQTCSHIDWYGHEFINETTFCAGYPSGGMDSCLVMYSSASHRLFLVLHPYHICREHKSFLTLELLKLSHIYKIHIFSAPALKSACKMLGQMLKSWNFSLSVFFLHFN